MQVSVESTTDLERKLTVRLPSDNLDKEVQKRLQSLSKRVKLDGFRPGKAPVKIIKQRYGDSVYQEVLGEIINKSLKEALENEKIQPAGIPEIEISAEQSEGEIAYTATFEVYPEFELAPMEDLNATVPASEIKEADVDAMIETLRKQKQTWTSVDRNSQKNDQITLDYKGTREGVAFEGGTAANQTIVLGEGRLIESFEQQLYDVKAGDEKTIQVTFPEDYPAKDLAGQAVDFEITIHAVKEPELPDLNDEFAKEFGVEEGGVEQLRKEVQQNMERELKGALKEQVKTALLDALYDANPITVPKSLVKEEISRMRDQVGDAMSKEARMNLPDELFEQQASRRIALSLLISKIIQHNDLKVDAEKVDATIQEIAESYEDPEEVIRYYRSNPDMMKNIEALALEDQVIDIIRQKATVTEENKAFQEVMYPTQSRS